MIEVVYGDCLEIMKKIKSGRIDLILADIPYGTTACKWDNVIPFEPMWKQLKRIIKSNGSIVLFGMEPFSSLLRISNLKEFKYDWIWKKSHPTGFLNAWKQPLRNTELISVFYHKQVNYNPQIEDKPLKDIRPTTGKDTQKTENYGNYVARNKKNQKLPDDKKMPRTILEFSGVNSASKNRFHPTQKPVALLEYLIKTYTNKGELVLDFTMGSGSTGVAAKNLGRSFIGIEKDEKYFKIAQDRIFNTEK